MATTFYSIHDVYLMHHGILGQKWGRRLYQNPDGSLTEEGKRRYGTPEKYQEHRDNVKRNVKRVAIGLGIAALTVGAVVGAVAGIRHLTAAKAAIGMTPLAKIKNGVLKENVLTENTLAENRIVENANRPNRGVSRNSALPSFDIWPNGLPQETVYLRDNGKPSTSLVIPSNSGYHADVASAVKKAAKSGASSALSSAGKALVSKTANTLARASDATLPNTTAAGAYVSPRNAVSPIKSVGAMNFFSRKKRK